MGKGEKYFYILSRLRLKS